MTYRHYGNIGDVWKHLVLCELLTGTDVKTYIETNSAYYAYKLDNTPGQKYGIGYFSENAHLGEKLQKSSYYGLIEPCLAKGNYPGSPAQAMMLLGKKECNFIFFDTDSAALESLRTGAKKLGLSDRIKTSNTDSTAGFPKMIPELDENSFVHIDPYLINKPGDNGNTYMDVFTEAARKGITCMMWYGFRTLNEKRELNRLILKNRPKFINQTSLCIEIILKGIRENYIPFNPGVMGCGVLISGPGRIPSEKIGDYASLLTVIYKNAVFTGSRGKQYNAALYSEKII